MKPKFLSQKASLFTALAAGTAAMLGQASAQTTLTTGDIKITSYNADAPDGFTFVLLRDVAANTALKITDGGFNTATVGASNAFRSTENGLYFRFTGAATAGTVVRVIDSSGTPTFTSSSGYTSGFSGAIGGLTGVSASGDQLLIYQGTGVPTAAMTSSASGWNVGAANNTATTFGGTLVEGLTFRGTGTATSWLTTGSASSNTSYLPSTLNVQDANLAIGAANSTHGRYNGSISGLTSDQYAAAISSATNWVTANANTTLSTTGFSVSSTSAVNWDANGATAGNGGAGTWDPTTSDRFKNGASGTTYMRWVNSSAGNSHTAVFGGTAGTVSVASGGVTASGLHFDTTGYLLQNNTVTLLGTAPSVNVTTGASTVTSALAGSNGLSKTGSGTLIHGGASSYSGGTSITQGTLRLSTANDRLPVGTVVSLGQAASANLGTLDLDGRNQQIAGLVSVSGTNAGSSTNVVTSGTAATLGINTSVATTHIYGSGSPANSGVIGGAVSVDKLGLGIQELGGNNTYTGITRILAGTLIVDGTHTGGGSYTVESGAVLGGNGTISSSIDFMAGAMLMFDPAATLTVNSGNVDFAGFGIDDLVGLESTVALGTYTLMDGTANFDFAGLANFGEVNKASIGGGKSAYFKEGSLQLVVIPEPSTALLGGLGLLLILRRRR